MFNHLQKPGTPGICSMKGAPASTTGPSSGPCVLTRLSSEGAQLSGSRLAPERSEWRSSCFHLRGHSTVPPDVALSVLQYFNWHRFLVLGPRGF